MDAATGKILFQKEADLRLPPASTTKVVTAILTLESGRKLTDSLQGVEGSHPGARFETLIYARANL